MIDHWTILQFLLTGEPMDTDKCSVKPPDVCGHFNKTAMDRCVIRSAPLQCSIRSYLHFFCSQGFRYRVCSHVLCNCRTM